MHDVSRMAVVDSAEDLFDDVGRVALAECVLLGYAFEEFAAIAQPKKIQKMVTSVAALLQSGYLLCDQEVALVVLEELVELQDVRMIHLLEDRNFALKLVLLVVF